MKSITKIDLDISTVNLLVQRAFKNGQSNPVENCTEIKQGYFNTIYSVIVNGKEIILKVAPKKNTRILRYEKNIMQAEVEALRRAKQHTAVPVPSLYYYDDSKEVGSYDYLLMEKLKGCSYDSISEDLSIDRKKEIEYRMGFYNGEINKIKGETFGYLAQPDKQANNWGDAFFNIVSDILADGREAGVKLPVPYDEIEALCRKLLFSCDDVKESRLVHWDLWPGNVLVHDGRISGIIDFERAVWGDPLMEYYFSGLYPNRDFCEGYGIELDSLDRNARIRRSLYNLYLYLVLKIECRYRGYEDAPQHTWAGQKIAAEYRTLEKM